MNNQTQHTTWLTLAEACEYTKFSKSFLYKKVMDRQIPFYKNGARDGKGKLFFKKSELDQWMDSFKVDVQQGPRGIMIEN
jgi:excisionase family DNA binding protein